MAKFITFYDISTATWTTLNTDTISKIYLGKKNGFIANTKDKEFYIISIEDYERIVKELSTTSSSWEKDLQWVKDNQKVQVEEPKIGSELTNANN